MATTVFRMLPFFGPLQVQSFDTASTQLRSFDRQANLTGARLQDVHYVREGALTMPTTPTTVPRSWRSLLKMYLSRSCTITRTCTAGPVSNAEQHVVGFFRAVCVRLPRLGRQNDLRQSDGRTDRQPRWSHSLATLKLSTHHNRILLDR